jgi:hypothetical protein
MADEPKPKRPREEETIVNEGEYLAKVNDMKDQYTSMKRKEHTTVRRLVGLVENLQYSSRRTLLEKCLLPYLYQAAKTIDDAEEKIIIKFPLRRRGSGQLDVMRCA